MQYIQNILDFFFGSFVRIRNTFLGILAIIVVYKTDEIVEGFKRVAQKILQGVTDVLTGSLPLIFLLLILLVLYRLAKGKSSPPPKSKPKKK